MAAQKGLADASGRAARARRAMEAAFEEAMVEGHALLLPSATGLPDAGDHHVLGAEDPGADHRHRNLRDFPAAILAPLGIEACSADDFIADTIALDTGRAIPAIRRMRQRFQRPTMTAETMLRDMEARGLVATVGVLAPHAGSL